MLGQIDWAVHFCCVESITRGNNKVSHPGKSFNIGWAGGRKSCVAMDGRGNPFLDLLPCFVNLVTTDSKQCCEGFEADIPSLEDKPPLLGLPIQMVGVLHNVMDLLASLGPV